MTLTKELIERIAESKCSDAKTLNTTHAEEMCSCRTCQVSRLFEETYVSKHVANNILDDILENACTRKEAVSCIVAAIAIGFELAEQVYESTELEKLAK